jgi:hypothetical protein
MLLDLLQMYMERVKKESGKILVFQHQRIYLFVRIKYYICVYVGIVKKAIERKAILGYFARLLRDTLKGH